MKISRLLEQHSAASHSLGIDDNWGDSYLCLHNKIYRNIRKASIQSGYKFNKGANENYQALPLSQLSAILKSKEIPYIDNVSVLKQIEDQIPNRAVWDDICDNLRKNFLFHESCHAVARSLSIRLDDEDRILNMLMEESFANTCELLAVLDANDSSHRIFYEWNSYTALFDLKTNLKNARDEIGIEALTNLIFFGYLHSNFLYNSMDEKHLNRVLKLGLSQKISVKNLKMVRAVIKICFTLDPRFKEVTSRFHMLLNGIKTDNVKLQDNNYIESFEKNTKYNDYVSHLIGLLSK